MRYRFHRCQPHARCPDLTEWYLVLRPDDVDTLMKLHKGVVGLYFFKFGMDPHIQKDKTQAALYHWAKLGAHWLMSVERYLMNGETLLVNHNGGIMPMDGVKVLETVESDNIHWDNRYDDEIITISRWPRGKHWYLASNKFQRLFIPAKYVNFEEARHEALRYTDHIRAAVNSGPLPPE